jgi:GTP cyclohydrolase I
MLPLPDVQGQSDTRGVPLSRVGVTGLYYPLTIRQKVGGHQRVTARIDLSVGLHAEQRGAHLSSLVEVLHTYHERLFSMDDLVTLLREVRSQQDERGLAIEGADIRIRFKYFLSKEAPASQLSGLVAYDCGFEVALDGPGFKSIIVGVPVTTVCPCSLQISSIGAHNQRAEVTVQLWQAHDDPRFIWFEDVVALVESCASSAVHSILKRHDEKAVTEAMFAAPRFVEDVVRDVVLRLRDEITGTRYNVRCESLESIHAHNAYAEATGP